MVAIIDVVKFNGPSNVFAWKFPSEELGTWTQLIVNETQEAVLFNGGQALDVFASGRHVLDTANIPILGKLINLPFGGRSPFAAEVWFVNKLHVLDIKWGTPSPIQLQDQKYGVFVPVRSFGQFGIKIEESKKFLLKLVGTMPVFDRDSILQYFRGLFLTKIKDSISAYLVHKKISILEINAYLDELSQHLKGRIEPTLAEYGITLVNFFINDINVPEDDPAVIQLKAALAKKAEMNIIGFNYQQERSFDTLEGAATNPGAAGANMMGAGLGLGMGVGLGGAVGTQFSALAQTLGTGPEMSKCPKCNQAVLPGTKYCSGCGSDLSTGVAVKSIKCDKCGAVFSKNARFCPECGDPYNPCPNCGADLAEKSDKCPFCGLALPKPCPLCGEPLVVGSKFCPACGGALVKKCSNCKAELDSSVKFCPECGQKLVD